MSGAAPYNPADVQFLAGMIGHHAQAIQMAGWAPSHGAGPSVRALCERIVVAQNDEIAFAQRWLREHGELVDVETLELPVLGDPEHADSGAITMVQQLLAVPGAAENGPVNRFATDVFADQTTEINRMNLMLADLKRSAP